MILFFYRLLINIIILFSPIIIFIRILKKKEDPIRFIEKFSFFSKKRVNGKLLWFHGASVGEILSVIPLLKKLEKDKNISQILLTSNTLSSSKILNTLYLNKTVHQFFPIDSYFFTKKFLNYWNPAIAVFIDSEIWPNMITCIKKKKIPLILLNGRINKKSFNRWSSLGKITKHLFSQFDICYPSSQSSKVHLKKLGVKKIKLIGNLKFSETKKDKFISDNKLKNVLGYKSLWCASSTHPTEEKLIALAHKQIKIKYKDLITIIIPRHVERTQSILGELKNLGLKIHLYSEKTHIKNNTDILLVDSYGKTNFFYSLTKIVFLGGSIIKHGGQNPLEAVRYGCNILHGPNIWNFHEVYKLLQKNGVSNKINNLKHLTNNVEKIFQKKNNTTKIENKIKKLGNKILNTTLKEINSHII